jgi:hypothetical protein
MQTSMRYTLRLSRHGQEKIRHIGLVRTVSAFALIVDIPLMSENSLVKNGISPTAVSPRFRHLAVVPCRKRGAD